MPAQPTLAQPAAPCRTPPAARAQQPPTIALIGPYGEQALLTRLWSHVAERWIGDDRPTHLHVVALEGLLGRADDAAVLERCDAALVVLPEGSGRDLPRPLLDVLTRTSTPALVLCAGCGHMLIPAASPGVITQPLDADPAYLAAILCGLTCARPSTRALERDLKIAQSLQAGAAAEVDRLHEELLLAAHVQRELLPKGPPEIPGLECAAFFRPCDFVSGDIYDACRLDEHHAGFYIADAMGHGLPAALMTFLIASNLSMKEVSGRSYRIVPPDEALTRLNRALCASRAGPSGVASAICGAIDARTRTVTLAGAGHPAPLLIRPGSVRRVALPGMLLGVHDEAVYEPVRFTLHEDEVLFLYSDGAERLFPETLADAPRARGALADLLDNVGGTGRLKSLAETLEHLAAELDQGAGSLHQADDVTVLAVAAALRADRP